MSETNQFVTKTALGAWEYQDETFEVKHTDVDYKVNLSTKFCKTQLTPLLQGDHGRGAGRLGRRLALPVAHLQLQPAARLSPAAQRHLEPQPGQAALRAV